MAGLGAVLNSYIYYGTYAEEEAEDTAISDN